jgi:potassium-dependent mechanosensitive channel
LKKKQGYKKVFCKYANRITIVLYAILAGFAAAAQDKAATRDSLIPDSAIKPGFVDRIQKFGKEEAARSIITFKKDRDAIKQEELIEDIKKTTLKAKAYLKTSIDTFAINTELEKVKSGFNIAGDGVFTNTGTVQTYRNLTTTSKILVELLNKTTIRKNQIDRYEKDLVNFRFKIDSLNSDTILYDFPSDSIALLQYLQKIVVIAQAIAPTDSALKKAVTDIRGLQTRVDLLVNRLNSSLEEVDIFQKDLSDKNFVREFPNLGAPPGYDRPFNEILSFSKAKGNLTILFYAQDNFGKILVVLLLIVALTIFLRTLKQILIGGKLLHKDFAGQLVLQYPFLSAVIIVLNLFQFMFPNPPFIFSCLFWIISVISLTVIFRNFITKFWMFFWLTMLLLFLLCCADNLILQASRTERWGMLMLASAGVLCGTFFLFSRHKTELREKLIIWFIGLLVLLELASIVTNIYGRYNLSKTLLVSGYCNVIIGILFLWTVRLINEALSLASRVNSKQEKKLFYINFELVGEKASPLFYVLLVVGWFILFGRNFYVFKLFTEPLKNFFVDERTIGSYTFTISNILLFFLIMALTFLTSKAVSFFTADKHPVHGTVEGNKNRKAGIGSWILLVRIAIICIGLFFGLAATGIPLDRITIVLGALGVGIGLGLQTVVNNLVSGLIIAFEKPVNVGDQVDVAGQSGTMKSIGFRSSIISNNDGADVIIPNGDLLNAHLVNWTPGGSKRRMDIIVGIAYGSDLEITKQILTGLLSTDERILKFPAPVVLAKGFNKSSIDMQLLFWIRNIKDLLAVNSDVISAIDIVFKKNGIVIPFPQQDVHIHPVVPDNVPDKDGGISKQ